MPPEDQPRAAHHLLAVIDSLELGGAQQHLLGLALGLRRLNYRFTVATSGSGHLSREFRRGGIAVLTLTDRCIKHRSDRTFATYLNDLVSGGRFDLVHAHTHSAAVAAWGACRKVGTPLLVTRHSSDTWQTTHEREQREAVDEAAGALIAVSPATASKTGRHSKRIRLIPNGVQIGRKELPRSALKREELGLSRTDYVLGFVGRLVTDKNPLLFLRVAAEIAKECPSARFLMVGDGPLRNLVMRKAERLGLLSRLLYLGEQPCATRFMRLCDVIVLTSKSEGSPLVSLEAMAMGKVVVATDVGDLRQQVDNERTGFVCSAGQWELAARCLQLSDPELRMTLSERARTQTAEKHSIERMLEETAAVYSETLS